ncbi:MAG: hypothetical protein IKP77_05710 [Acholeplasmatales bacterium]|nr:hypothetical protein [Acholeplasmatales bacterium]MBR6288583.1 hypothetical protein [Acholeplasmatales bacterium]
MTSQNYYNTQVSKLLLQVLIYIIDNKQITADDFVDITGADNLLFYKLMPEFRKMLSRLNMNISMLKSDIDKEEIQIKKSIYFFNIGFDPYYYDDMTEFSEEEQINYSLVIMYLMLKNNQYVSTATLKRLFPRFTKQLMQKLKESLLDVIAEDIDKNEYNSLILIDYE